MAHLPWGPHQRFALPPRPPPRRGPGKPPDAFDHWLDRSLKELFDDRTGQALPPEVRSLLDPRPGKPKPEPPKRS